MIIIEGCDNTGKTTLFHKLRIDLNHLGIMNVRPLTRSGLLHTCDKLIDLKLPVIMDRWASISESIYGPICRNDHMLTGEDLVRTDRQLYHRHAIVVFCNLPLVDIRKTIHEREQMDGVVKYLESLHQAYLLRMLQLRGIGVHVIEYNYLTTPYETLLNQLKELQC